tara:strand:- start:349 stop:2286 length:1938 start_codon:yes stop_codon:yes gene_type:complete
MKFFLILISSLGFFSCSFYKTPPPNIIIILTDDQGYSDLGVFGAKDFDTPHLDKMANEGMIFTDFHVAQSVCSASRAALLTGCYSERVSVRGAYNHTARVGLNPDEETIAEILKSEGYATGIFGKWHLGHHKEFLPLQQGFDEFFGLPYSNDMWPVNYDGTPKTEKSFWDYPYLPLIEGNEKIEEIRTLQDQDRLTTRYTNRAVNFMIKNKKNPFLLYLAHSMPHVPLGVSNKFRGKTQRGIYGDVISELDWSVGQILTTLKELEIYENTLVIFASDNGPWLNYGSHAGSASPLREGKGTMWEGGARVPAIMLWPGTIMPNSKYEQLASTIDILPTIADIVGANLPKKKIDGVSMKSLLLGGNLSQPIRDQFYYYYGGELIGVREGDWKLIFPHKYRSYLGVDPGKNGYPGRYSTGKTDIELYNLKEDIGETIDLAKKYPDIIRRLTKIGNQARDDLGDRLKRIKGKGIRQEGRLDPQRDEEDLNVKHIAIDQEIKIFNFYSDKYSGGGEGALVNGLRGSLDYLDGNWQGYEGRDLEALIDMGSLMKLKSVEISFLQNQGSWIFFPLNVKFSFSKDRTDFQYQKQINNDLAMSYAHEIKSFRIDLPEVNQFQYIKIKAKNVSVCPEWHPGSGGKAWVFADEVVVR